ncbi:hypothetical protein V4V35_25660 [Bacillus infantis]|uniref:hypothetical protein n=1 Tax=Bacillus infantis TaxID=324767 RepID=UPI002FBEF19B
MSKNKIIKSVSFNISSKEEARYLEQIKDINFSGYVKELIATDINRRNEALKIVHKSESGGIKIVIGG